MRHVWAGHVHWSAWTKFSLCIMWSISVHSHFTILHDKLIKQQFIQNMHCTTDLLRLSIHSGKVISIKERVTYFRWNERMFWIHQCGWLDSWYSVSYEDFRNAPNITANGHLIGGCRHHPVVIDLREHNPFSLSHPSREWAATFITLGLKGAFLLLLQLKD